MNRCYPREKVSLKVIINKFSVLKIQLRLDIKQFSVEFRKTKTQVITLANYNRNRH